MEKPAPTDVTEMLLEIGSGHDEVGEVSERLYEAVYGELRRIAGGLMRRERVDHTLQPTALVHEAFLKLVDRSRCQWENRAHFYGVAARAMRQVLVDHARRYQADKRGGDWHRVTLDENLEGAEQVSLELLAVHEALDKLSHEDDRVARVAELRLFAGLISKEVAYLLGVSKRTVDGDWKIARMWLARELTGRDGP